MNESYLRSKLGLFVFLGQSATIAFLVGYKARVRFRGGPANFDVLERQRKDISGSFRGF